MTGPGPAKTPDEAFVEPPELYGRNLWAGARLLAGTTILFFISFVFAYFYLKSFNNNDNWRPPGIDPPAGYGVAIVILFVASAAAFSYASWAGRRSRPWLGAVGLSLALGLAGVVVQGFEYADLGFGPLDGGYASVFMGWTLFFAVFVLLAMYWVETTLATGLRQRRAGDAYVSQGIDAASFYWTLLAAIGVVAWFILYIL